jgi:nucleotide-binding universal stress UspA family protein
MIKDILVVLEPGEEGLQVDEFALSLSSQLGAHLTAAGVALQTIAPVSFMGDYPYELMAQATDEARAAAQRAFERLNKAAPAGVNVDYVPVEGFTSEAIDRVARLARHYDLTIVRQNSPDEDGFASQLAVGTIFGSGRPCIMMPYIHKGGAKLGKAMVAWDGGVVAARALAGALPLLQKAGKVEVVTVAKADQDIDAVPGFDITRHLARHGINATLKQLPPTSDIAAILLSHAADSAPDYIVMGCYGHSRLRELVLGGTTREILGSMTVPIIMAH